MSPGGGPRLLLRRLREIMAEQTSAQMRLDKLVTVIASNMVAEVCSIYLRRAGKVLELFATEGLRHDAVHQTRLKEGEFVCERHNINEDKKKIKKNPPKVLCGYLSLLSHSQG